MKQAPTVLIVDDEQKVRDLLGFRLQLLGYRVVIAESGEEALTLADAQRPDLIILDVTMPGLDGVTVCSRLKRSETLGAVPIVMLTARSEAEDLNKAMAAYRRSLKLDPKQGRAHLLIGLMHVADGKCKKARRALEGFAARQKGLPPDMIPKLLAKCGKKGSKKR